MTLSETTYRIGGVDFESLRQGIIENLGSEALFISFVLAWKYREKAGEIYNNLRYRLGESPAPVTETVDALSMRVVSPQAEERIVTGAIRRFSGSSHVTFRKATDTLEAARKKPRIKHEIYRIADTVLYYFT